PWVAMTGEITLTGHVLPVGGIKEKVLAARRSGIREIILSRHNEPNVLEDLPAELIHSMRFHYVSSTDEALLHAFYDPEATVTEPLRRSESGDGHAEREQPSAGL